MTGLNVIEKMSLGKELLGRNVHESKCMSDEMSTGQNVLSAVCPEGEISVGRNVP
jgi:hypothetical protein